MCSRIELCVAQCNTLAAGAARKACMCPKAALVSAEQLLVAFSVSSAPPPYQASVHHVPDHARLPMAAHTETSLGSICVYEGTRRLDNDKGDGIAPTAKAARWRTISRRKTVWHTCWNHHQQARFGYAGAPHAALQRPNSAMRSLAASLGYAQIAHPVIPCGMHQPPPRCRC